jgi:hypothetical protein
MLPVSPGVRRAPNLLPNHRMTDDESKAHRRYPCSLATSLQRKIPTLKPRVRLVPTFTVNLKAQRIVKADHRWHLTFRLQLQSGMPNAAEKGGKVRVKHK